MAGVDHTRANVDIRSIFSFTKRKMEDAYTKFMENPAISGCIILSTCNRMEFYVSTRGEHNVSPLELLFDYLGVGIEDYSSYFQTLSHKDAVRHLFRLSSGLESKIMGEDQILTQVGDALMYARQHYATDHTLEVLFRLAVTAGKLVKTQTDLSTADRSVIHVALDLLKEKGIEVAGKKCMVIGNGMMGKLSAQTLQDYGGDVTVTVRQYTNGLVQIPKGCSRINYKDRLELLPQCDIIVSATSSPNFTLCKADLEKLRPDHKIPLIDLAVPRDIEPEINDLDQFDIYDIDSFEIGAKTEKFQTNIQKAEDILLEQETEFYDWYEGRDLVPLIDELKQKAGDDVNIRLTQTYKKLSMTSEEKNELSVHIGEAVEHMMNRLLFETRARLSDETFLECAEAVSHTFRHWNLHK